MLFLIKATSRMSIGLIIGNGNIPQIAIEKLKQESFYVIALDVDGITYPYLNSSIPHSIHNIAKVGGIIEKLKDNNVSDIVMIGGITAPNLKSLKPDTKGFVLLSKLLKLKLKGDDNLLRGIIQFLEQEKFRVISILDILPELALSKNDQTKLKPNKHHLKNIEIGFNVLKEISNLDIGQSIVVQDERIIGIEAQEGTDELIKRCALYQNSGTPILIKTSKTTQDKRVDIPTIGIETIDNLIKYNFAGIAIESDKVIAVNKNEILARANENSIFISVLESL